MGPRTRQRLGPRTGQSRFVVVTGLSGAGKSQAIHAIEDLGYFCVDNLPTSLVPMLASLAMRTGTDLEKVAVVLDVREAAFLPSLPMASCHQYPYRPAAAPGSGLAPVVAGADSE